MVGSTFQHWLDDAAPRAEDDVDNLEKLSAAIPKVSEGLEIVSSRVGFRCASKDRLPIIGRVPDQKGLYVSIAHGSHGLLSGLMGSEMLAADICGEEQILPSSVARGLGISRFARKV